MGIFRGILVALLISLPASAQDSWTTTRAQMTRARAYHAAVTTGGRIYVFAGDATGSPIYVHSMDVYDPATDAWTSRTGIAEYPGIPGRQVGWKDPGGVAFNGDIYQIGGMVSINMGSWPLTIGDPASFKYSIATDTWTQIAGLPAWPQEVEATVAGSKIYAMGSATTNGLLYEYDPSNNTWATKPALPSGPPSAFVMAGLAGKVIVSAGMDGTQENARLFTWEFDPSTNQWTARAPIPNAAIWGASAVAKGRLFVLGGFTMTDGQFAIGQAVQEYNPQTDQWTQRLAMPSATAWNSAVAMLDSTGEIAVYSTGGLNLTTFGLARTNHLYNPIHLPRPENPTGLFMRQPGKAAMAEGDWMAGTAIELGATLNDLDGNQVSLEAEVVPAGSAFTGIPNVLGTYVTAGEATATYSTLSEGAWKWRCRSRNANDEVNLGNWIEFGGPAPDFNVDLTAPSTPAGISPVVQADVYDKKGGPVTFAWSPSTDNSPFEITYEVEVSRDATFSILEASGSVTGAESLRLILTPSFTLRHWRVRSFDFGGRTNGSWSAPLTFQVNLVDLIDHAAGDAMKVCGFSSPGGSSWIAFAVLAALLMRRRLY